MGKFRKRKPLAVLLEFGLEKVGTSPQLLMTSFVCNDNIARQILKFVGCSISSETESSPSLKKMSKHTMLKPILGYWNIRSYGQPIRFMLAYLGIDFENKLYSDYINHTDWWADKFNLGLDFPNLPYYIEGDIRLTETKAILRYLAKEKGQAKKLFPTESVSVRQSDMLENVVYDTWTLLARIAYVNSDPDKEKIKTEAPLKCEAISKFLGNKKFLLGDQLTYVDFINYELLFFYTAYDAEYLKPYPNLAEYKKRFEAIPEIMRYTKSPNYGMVKGCTSPTAINPIGY